MFVLRHFIYEGDDQEPTLSHDFFGETEDKCLAIMRAHMTTDEFLRGAVNEGRWRSIRLTTRTEWIVL